MDKKTCFNIGKAVKTHNIKGETIIAIKNINIDFDNVDVFFVDINSCLVPFFVDSLKIRDTKSIIVSFDKIDSPEKAMLLIDKDFYILEKYINFDSNSNYFNDIEGYTVTDTNLGYIGVASDIVDIPGNTLLKVNANEKEILIPLIDDFIIEINHNVKSILVKTPTGLIDLYR